MPAGDTYLLPQITGLMKTGFWPVFRPRFPMSHVNIANVLEGTRLAAQKGRPGQIYFLVDKEQPTDSQDFMLRYAATQARRRCECCVHQTLRLSSDCKKSTSAWDADAGSQRSPGVPDQRSVPD